MSKYDAPEYNCGGIDLNEDAKEHQRMMEEEAEKNKVIGPAKDGTFRGRPVGSKGKTTLFKEAMRDGFENVLEREGMKVFIAVCQRAIGTAVKDADGKPVLDDNGNQLYEGGSDVATKIIMDRIMPVASVEEGGKGDRKVIINISGMNSAKLDVMEGEFEEMDQD